MFDVIVSGGKRHTLHLQPTQSSVVDDTAEPEDVWDIMMVLEDFDCSDAVDEAPQCTVISKYKARHFWG